MSNQHDKLGDILLKLGYVSEHDLDKALEAQRASGGEKKLGEILSQFILREDQLLQALSMQKAGYMMDASLAIVSRILKQRLQKDDVVHILNDINASGKNDFVSKIADILDKLAAFIDISSRLSDSRSLDLILQNIIEITTEALNAERGTLFLNDQSTGELFSRITHGGHTSEIRFRNNVGIAGAVFGSGQPIIIMDAYSDPRFNKEIDRETGFKTRNILCSPIKARNNEIIGVIQMLNKKDADFCSDDLILLEAITSQASAALQNARLFDEIQKAKDEESQLLDVTAAISSELDLEALLIKIMETTTEILSADRSTLFLHDEKTSELWAVIAQGAGNKIRFPSHVGIAGSVFTTGETVNIPDAYADSRFNPSFDKQTGYVTKSILCMPVISKEGKTIGVTQVLNKKGGPFTGMDEKRLKAFSSQASIAIQNAKLFEEVLNMKNYNESILESMSNGVITIDARHKIIKCNSPALKILNVDNLSLVGINADEYFTGKNSWIMEAVERVLESGESDITMDTELLLKDGSNVSINLTVVPMKSVKGEYMGVMIIMEDITKEKRIKVTMARYMTKDVADKLLEGGESALGGQIQEATVLFSDIRSFTSISEKIGAQQTVSMLNEYFTVMVDIIFQHHGILDKYIGDAILAVFGIPFAGPEDVDKSVRASIDMMNALAEYNRVRLSKEMSPLDIGIGINTAEVLAGNIGSLKRMDYTVIGDGVNLASRLESATKYYRAKVLISEFTKKKLKGNYQVREIDYIKVKGKDRPVGIYEVLDFHNAETFPNLPEVVGYFSEGLELYREMKWEKALERLEKAISLNKNDCPSKMYLERCQYFIKTPPADNWDRIWVMKEK